MWVVDRLPDQGRSILGLIDSLDETDSAFLVRMSPSLNSFKASLFNGEGNENILEESEQVSYRKGIKGLAGFNGHEVYFELSDFGDNLFIGIGETNGERTRIAAFEFSNHVKFEDEMLGEDPKRFHKLASKIILD